MYFTYLLILHILHFDSKYILFCRTAQKEKIQREKEEAKKERAQQFTSAVTMTAATHALPTPTLPSPVTPTQATPLCSPQVTPQSTETPHTSKCRGYAAPTSPASTVDSLDSLIDPGRDRTPVIYKRGRPRKVLQPPSYDDCPVNASAEEMKKWQKRKNSEKWRYKNLHQLRQMIIGRKKRKGLADM